MRATAATGQDGHPPSEKISAQFFARLKRLKPNDRLRAVVLLNTPETDGKSSRVRPTREERRQEAGNLRDSLGSAVREIDEILERVGGRRLSQQPSALGTLAIETTTKGIAALVESDYVKTIVDDQPIALVR